MLEAFERTTTSAANVSSSSSSSSDVVDSVATPAIDIALRSSLLKLVLAMMERLPTGALIDAPTDVLNAYAQLIGLVAFFVLFVVIAVAFAF